MFYVYVYINEDVYVYIHKQWKINIYLAIKKEGNSAIFDNAARLWGHCAKWNKSDRERQILISLSGI